MKSVPHNFQHAVIPTVDDEQGSRGIHAHAVRLIEFGHLGRAADTGGAFLARAGDADESSRLDTYLRMT